MNQPVEDALRAAFDRTSTGLDHNPARYQQVAARRRRRRLRHAAGAAGASGAVLALTAGLVLTLGAGRDQAGPAGPATGTGTVDCPPPATGSPAPTAAPASGPLVPEGASAVRACGFLGVTIIDGGAGRVVAALNALPRPETVQACTDIGGFRYDLVLAYPDGGRVTVRVDTSGCGTARAGDQVRVGSAELGPLLSELAEEQRWAGAPADPPAPGCPEPATLTRPVGDTPAPPRYDAFLPEGGESVPYPAVAVAVCRYSSSDPATATLLASEVATGGAERARELVNGQGPEVPFWVCQPPAGSFDVLVFADEAGGMYEVRLGRGECKLFYSARHLSDEPEPDLRRWVDDTLGGPPPG